MLQWHRSYLARPNLLNAGSTGSASIGLHTFEPANVSTRCVDHRRLYICMTEKLLEDTIVIA